MPLPPIFGYLEFSAHDFQNDADEVDDCPGGDVEATTVPNVYVNEGRDGGQELTANAMPRTTHGNVDVMVQETVKAFGNGNGEKNIKRYVT